MSKRSMLIFVLAAFYLSGCGNDNNSPPPIPTEPPPMENNSDFTNFIKTQLSDTSDQTEPVDINSIEFVFDENVNAFNDVF